MNKLKNISLLTSGIITLTLISTPAYAMDWTDGVQVGNTYTYKEVISEKGTDPINGVYVKDKNNTVDKEINPGDSVTSKTGTITWKDSYENVTAFYLDVEDGYEISVYVDGKKGEIFDLNNENSKVKVKVNSDLGSDSTYELESKAEYDKVFYFSSAGKEAWSRGHDFEIRAEKKEYEIPIRIYDKDNNNGNPIDTKIRKFKHGDTINRDDLGLSNNEYIVGANEVTITENTKNIDIVTRSKDEDFENYEYGFTYVGEADQNVKSVKAYWNNDRSTEEQIELNETARLKTHANLNKYKINFIIDVESGFALRGVKGNNEDLNIKYVGNENSNTYEIEFTRVAHHGMYPVPINENFTLETYKIY